MQHLFLDESGDHSLKSLDAGYPVFVLGGVIVSDDAIATISATLTALKQDCFGNPSVLLHTADITRNRRGFESLADPTRRARFRRLLADALASLDFRVIACAIRKADLLQRYGDLAVDPYLLSLGIVVERFCFDLSESGMRGIIHVERRNERLDRELRVAWDVLGLNGTRYVRAGVLRRRIIDLVFETKTSGGAALEIADLVVTPLGRWVAGMPAKPDLDVVMSKLRRGPADDWKGAGLVVLPKESGRGPLRNTRPPRV